MQAIRSPQPPPASALWGEGGKLLAQRGRRGRRNRDAPDLLDQLLENRLRERLVVVGGDHKCPLTANHVGAVIAGDGAVLVENGKAVDRNPLQHRAVAQPIGRGTLIGAAVAGNINHPAPSVEAISRELAQSELNGAADRRAAAVKEAGRFVNGFGKGSDTRFVSKQLPVHSDLLAAIVRPLDHRYSDTAAA